MATPSVPALIDTIAELHVRVRERRPLVHCLTNFVTLNDVANVLLAFGALPVMASAIEEVAEMADQADALVLNLGTPSRERIEAMLVAGQAAQRHGIPVVVDPVGVGATSFRVAAAKRLLEEAHPAIVRGNAAEVARLAGRPAASRGVESVGEADVAQQTEAAQALARQRRLVVAATGARDIVTDGTQTLAVDNGHLLLRDITGAGDMATALVAALAAVEPDRLLAAAGALVLFGLAAERAAATAGGPGGFRIGLFDALYNLTVQEVVEGGKVVRI